MSGVTFAYIILISVVISWAIFGVILYLTHRDYHKQHILRGENKDFLIYAANDEETPQ